MDFEMDKLNGRNDTNKISSIKLNQLTETYDLIDIYRNKYPQKNIHGTLILLRQSFVD